MVVSSICARDQSTPKKANSQPLIRPNDRNLVHESSQKPNSSGGFREPALPFRKKWCYPAAMLPERKRLPHGIPSWVRDGAIYFITICTQPRGENQLCQPKTAAWIHDSFDFCEQRGDWWTYLLLLMPDHLHAVMSFAQKPGMSHALSQWKRYAARECRLSWQRDFFEHRMRDEDNRVEKSHYIRMNPVRAGLVTKPEDWPYVWSQSPW